jgi:hypothetical protein
MALKDVEAAGTVPPPTIAPVTSARRRTKQQRDDDALIGTGQAHKRVCVLNVRLTAALSVALDAEATRVELPKSTVARNFIEQGLAAASQVARAPAAGDEQVRPHETLAAIVRALVADALRRHHTDALDSPETDTP